MAEAKKSTSELAVILDTQIQSVIKADGMDGFKRAFIVAEAMERLNEALTPEYMKPIMKLQNTKLGFLTDKKEGGYSEVVVKACLIEAVLTGFQPYGNQFNIIAGNMYGTKEGFGSALALIPGLIYNIVPSLPRIDQVKYSAAVMMKITWSLHGGPTKEQDIEFAVMVNQYTAKPDTVIGKATRKARAWLFSNVTGVEVGEADVQETTYTEVKDTGITYEDLMELYELKKNSLLQAERTSAQRILALDKSDVAIPEGKPETASFKKLRDSMINL